MSSLSPTRLHALHDRIRQELADGLISGAQLAVGLDGKVVAFDSLGAATPGHSFALFSATKTLVAMALLPHLADGSLDLTTPVAHYLRAFGHHGKDDVTVLQLLTMQGGFPQAPMGPDEWGTSEGRRAAFAQWRLDWPAGTRTASGRAVWSKAGARDAPGMPEQAASKAAQGRVRAQAIRRFMAISLGC